MKKKCSHCQGKGGWLKQAGRFTFYVSCTACLGKGKWWPNNRPRQKAK